MKKAVIKFKSAVFLFILMATISGCSRVTWIYTYSDFLIVRKIDGYFDINSRQKKMLYLDAFNLMTWHQKNELPKLITSLVELKTRFSDGFSRDDIKWATDELREYWQRFLLQGSGSFAKFLTLVKKDQVSYLKKAMAKKNDFLVEQMSMDDEELLNDTMEWFYDMVEDWVGYLNAEQRKSINLLALVDHEWVVIKLNRRKSIQRAFAELVESGKNQNEIEKTLRLWVDYPETTGTPEYRNRWDKRKILWRDILIKTDSRLTSKQRVHALDKIQDYIDDFRSLAKKRAY